MKTKLINPVVAFGIMAAFVSTLLATPAYSAEDKAACVFVSLNNSAWVMQKDSQVKSTLKVGDVLKMGDRVIVTHGNKVQLSFDKDCKNIVQVEGDAMFYMDPAQPAKIQLQKGKMFALLDNLSPGSQFAIQTPTAVAAVRGTQYQVNILGQQSNIMTYRGRVLVSSVDAQGNETLDSVILEAGQKTSVDEVNKAPAEPSQMTEGELSEITVVSDSIDYTRKTIDSSSIESWLTDYEARATQGSSESSSLVKSKSTNEDEDPTPSESQKGGFIV